MSKNVPSPLMESPYSTEEASRTTMQSGFKSNYFFSGQETLQAKTTPFFTPIPANPFFSPVQRVAAPKELTPEKRTPNRTGLPDKLKSGVESLSGLAMDDVKVHYNSPQPAQLHAHAYAQGNQIHIAPGQERHLPHEAWHVVQQKQGRVRPTMQLKGKVNINDDAGLEREADVMGGKAMKVSANQGQNAENTGIQKLKVPQMNGKSAITPFQRKIIFPNILEDDGSYFLQHLQRDKFDGLLDERGLEVLEKLSVNPTPTLLFLYGEGIENVIANFVKQIVAATSPTLKEMLLQASQDFGGMRRMETLWSEPEQALATNKDDLEDAILKLPNGAPKVNYGQVKNMKVKDYVQELYSEYISTGSCGQTTNILEEALGESGRGSSLITAKKVDTLISKLSENARSNPGPWYCRVATGGHSFLIEFIRNTFRIYQSFFGVYPLAKDLEKDNVYSDLSGFLEKLKVALSPNKGQEGSPSEEQRENRRALFSSQALHPEEINYKFTFKLSTPANVVRNIKDTGKKREAKWERLEDQDMSSYIEEPVAFVAPDQVILDTDDLAKRIENRTVWDEEISVNITALQSLNINTEYYLQWLESGFILTDASAGQYTFTKVMA